MGVGASNTTPLDIHFSNTESLIRFAAAKSFFDMVGEVANATALFIASLTASLITGIKIAATLAMKSLDCTKSNAFWLFAFSVCITQYLLVVV